MLIFYSVKFMLSITGDLEECFPWPNILPSLSAIHVPAFLDNIWGKNMMFSTMAPFLDHWSGQNNYVKNSQVLVCISEEMSCVCPRYTYLNSNSGEFFLPKLQCIVHGTFS